MEKEIKDLLQQVLANQVVIYKRLEEIEKEIKGGYRHAPLSSYYQELKDKANEPLVLIKKGG